MISFIRIDDRMIHGQTVTRWALEYPCDGLIAVNDAAASNPVLKEAYKSASGKKTFVWTKEHFKEVSEKVLKSDTKYFLITKNPLDMKELLVDFGFKPGMDRIIVGPCNDRPGTTKLGNTSRSRRKRPRRSRISPTPATRSSSPLSRRSPSVSGPSSAVSLASS